MTTDDIPADILSGRAIRPADCDHDDECDCELVSLCPACGEPIDYCQGHGEIGDPAGYAQLQAHDHERHASCHPDGCDYLHEHEAGRHSLCRPAWCASVLSFEDAAAARNSRAYLETMTAEQTLEAMRLLIAERGHTPQAARLAGDVAREWLQAHPEYIEEMA